MISHSDLVTGLSFSKGGVLKTLAGVEFYGIKVSDYMWPLMSSKIVVLYGECCHFYIRPWNQELTESGSVRGFKNKKAGENPETPNDL